MTTSRDGAIAMFFACISAFMVTKVKNVELEKKVSLAGKLFRRLLGASRGFQESVSLRERDAHVGVPRNSYYSYPEEIKTAMESESKKAEALMERQRRLSIC